MTRRGMHRRPVVWLIATLCAVAVLPFDNEAAGSCASPWLSIGEASASPEVSPSQELTVRGRAFAEGCHDTGGSTDRSTIGSCSPPRSSEEGMKDVTLVLRQGSREWELGTQDAGAAADGKLGHITWNVSIPADVRPGRAVLVADYARLPLRITRG